MLTYSTLPEHTCCVLVSLCLLYLSPPPTPSQPGFLAMWWESRWAASLFAFPPLPLFFFCFFFLLSAWAEAAEKVSVPLPSPSIHVSLWCNMPSDLRRSLTRTAIHWLLLARLISANTAAGARNEPLYAFITRWGGELLKCNGHQFIIYHFKAGFIFLTL